MLSNLNRCTLILKISDQNLMIFSLKFAFNIHHYSVCRQESRLDGRFIGITRADAGKHVEASIRNLDNNKIAPQFCGIIS